MITRSNFDGYVNLSEHCALGDDIWEVYAREVQRTDMRSLLGNCFFGEVLKNRNDAKYQELLDGSTYTVDGEELTHFGLRAVMVHYTFAAYMYRGGIVDTPYSAVQKMSEDSIPVPIQELRNFKDEHRHIGYQYWKQIEHFLCAKHKEDSTYWGCFDDCNCPAECTGCDDKDCKSCKGGSPSRTRRYKLKVISK